MVLRAYGNEDFEAICALDAVCFAPEFAFSRRSMRKFIGSSRARMRVADEGGVVGFCVVHVEPVQGGSVGYVVTLDVAPEWRRRGLAAMMLGELEAELAAEGCRTMLLHVSVENVAAVRFYEVLGWERGHTVEGFYGDGMDALVYRKVLGSSAAS